MQPVRSERARARLRGGWPVKCPQRHRRQHECHHYFFAQAPGSAAALTFGDQTSAGLTIIRYFIDPVELLRL